MMKGRVRLAMMGGFLLLLLFFVFPRGGENPPTSNEKPSITEEREDTTGPSNLISLSKLGKVRIFPSDPDLGSVLQAEITTESLGQGEVHYRYRWRVNGKEMSDQPILPLERFRQGDVIEVEVIPSNGGSVGDPVRSMPVRIGNRPPKLTALKLVPDTPTVGEPVRVAAESLDADGNFVQYRYHWYVNDKLVDGNSGETLDGKLFRSGDTIYAIVIPFDASEGSARISKPVRVANRTPKISSMPPTEINGDQYIYQVSAKDPDEDLLRFQLVEGPPGMTLDPASGLLTWKPDALDKKVNAVIEVDDAKGGKAIQRLVIGGR
ncbi:MAG: putative Ig domain-containing protein [Blastocatellia bacterium]